MRTKDLYLVDVNSYANMYAIYAHIVCISILMSFPFTGLGFDGSEFL